MLWKKKIGEGRVHCSRVMVLDRRRLEVSGWKTKELSIGRWTELVRQNVQLVEIRCVIAVFDIFFVSIIHTDLPSFLSFLFFCICVWTWISAADKVKLKLDSTLRTVNASCFLKCDYSKIQIDAEWVDCAITPKLVFLCLLLSWCFTSRETITLIRDRDCPDELHVIAWRLTEDNQIFGKTSDTRWPSVTGSIVHGHVHILGHLWPQALAVSIHTVIRFLASWVLVWVYFILEISQLFVTC